MQQNYHPRTEAAPMTQETNIGLHETSDHVMPMHEFLESDIREAANDAIRSYANEGIAKLETMLTYESSIAHYTKYIHAVRTHTAKTGE